MSDEEKSKSWWQTLPGVIAGLTAIVTALAGLVVAVKQTGWFGPQSLPHVAGPKDTAPTQPPASSPMTSPSQSPPAVTSAPPGTAHSVALPAMRDYRLGSAGYHATFTLLKAEVSPLTAEKDELRIRLRMMNHDRYDANFWDRGFRLIVNGVPAAPESELNELVPGHSAKEGDVMFVIPRGTAEAKLKIIYNDDATEIPLELQSTR